MDSANQLLDIAKIFRAARKESGLTQIDAAKLLGVEQSALSRMENGKQGILAFHWFIIAEQAQVSADSVRWGYIEHEKPAILKVDNRDNFYSLPIKYAKDRGSKVRTSLPLFDFVKRKSGEEYLNKYIQSKKIDPDFFLNLDNQINIQFNFDLFEHLIEKNLLTPSEIGHITKDVNLKTMHGSLDRHYTGKNDPGKLLKSLVRNAVYYECNHLYKIENEASNSLELSVKPQWHIDTKKYKHNSILNNTVCLYRQSYFQNFSKYNENQKVKIQEKECYHHTADKCVYELSWT